jgi:hypothetical protein
LRDANFKREMKSINTSSNKFANNLKRSDENLNLLQGTINGFNGQNIPNQIKMDVDQVDLLKKLNKVVDDFDDQNNLLTLQVSQGTLDTSIRRFIKGLHKGQNIDHLPLKILESSLKDSINAFIEKAGKGIGGTSGGNQAGILPLPLKIDVPFLVASVNKFLEQALKGKTDIGKSAEKKGKKKKAGDTEPEKTESNKDPITMLLESLTKLNATQDRANELLEDIKQKTGGDIEIPGL